MKCHTSYDITKTQQGLKNIALYTVKPQNLACIDSLIYFSHRSSRSNSGGNGGGCCTGSSCSGSSSGGGAGNVVIMVVVVMKVVLAVVLVGMVMVLEVMEVMVQCSSGCY